MVRAQFFIAILFGVLDAAHAQPVTMHRHDCDRIITAQTNPDNWLLIQVRETQCRALFYSNKIAECQLGGVNLRPLPYEPPRGRSECRSLIGHEPSLVDVPDGETLEDVLYDLLGAVRECEKSYYDSWRLNCER